MATVSSNKPHWRDAALAGSEVITDAWEVTKAYLGRLADWVLFICMVMNILEIIPFIHISDTVTGIVLAIQAVTLDVGGFALLSMAEHAESQGRGKQAKQARHTAYWLVGIMIVTLVLIASKALYPDPNYVAFADNADKILILVRIGMTVIYGKVIHGLRGNKSQTLNITQLATLEERLNHQITKIETESSQSVANLQKVLTTGVASEVAKIKEQIGYQVGHSVAENLATMRQNIGYQVAQTVASEVAKTQQDFRLLVASEVANSPQAENGQINEQIGYLVKLVNDQARTIQNLTNVLTETRREFRTTVTEIRSITQEMPALPAGNPANTVEASSQNIDESSQNASEKGKQVIAFLATWKGPKRPTLQQIMDTCTVAKKTATYWREKYYGSQTEDEE